MSVSEISPALHLKIPIFFKNVIVPSTLSNPEFRRPVSHGLSSYLFVQFEQLLERVDEMAICSFTRSHILIELSAIATGPAVK